MLDSGLKDIDIPGIVLENDNNTNITAYVDKISQYYELVIYCIQVACYKTMPKRVCASKSEDYVVSGWNEYVNDKHEAARQAYLDWVYLNKPRQGPSFVLMKQSRAQFKLALRCCKQHENMMRADAAAASLACNDYRKFWSSVQKSSGTRASTFVNIVDGCTGDSAIVNR